MIDSREVFAIVVSGMALVPTKLPPLDPEPGKALKRNQGPSYKISGMDSKVFHAHPK